MLIGWNYNRKQFECYKYVYIFRNPRHSPGYPLGLLLVPKPGKRERMSVELAISQRKKKFAKSTLTRTNYLNHPNSTLGTERSSHRRAMTQHSTTKCV